MDTLDKVIRDFRKYAAADPNQAGWIEEMIRHLQHQEALHQQWVARRQADPSDPMPRFWSGVAYEPDTNPRRPWRAFYMRDGRPHTIARYTSAISAARSHDHECWKRQHDLSLLNFPEEYEDSDRPTQDSGATANDDEL